MKKFIRIVLFGCLLVASCLLPLDTVFAQDAYKTYTMDGGKRLVESQPGYSAVKVINRIGETRLNGPTDMRLGSDGNLYIADTGNRRILVTTKNGDLISEFTNEAFQHPVGVFPHNSGKIYVADDSANKIFILDSAGKLTHTFEKPDDPAFGIKNTFQPTKIVVDNRENVYALSRGNNNGIIMLNATTPGEFLGYFAPNTSQVSLMTQFRKMIFSEEQLDKMVQTAPNSADNLAIDEKGLIYTVTSSENGEEPIKKLNIGGTNLLEPNFALLPRSVTVGGLDNIFVLSEDGFIYEYTAEGEFLFLFAGTDDGQQRNGLLGKGAAIAVDEANNLYTLDEKKNEIQVFQPTTFANELHAALDLYQNGRYEESKSIWQNILNMNSQFDMANLGIGYAYYEEGNYEAAEDAFRKAQDKAGYSDSFWELRNVWIKQNIVKVIIGIVAILLAWMILKRVDKRFGILKPWHKMKHFVMDIPIVKQTLYVFYVMRHPIDGAYGLKKEEKTSSLAALLIFVLAAVVYVCDKYFTGFIFSMVKDGRYTLGQDLLIFIVVICAVLICTYLIVTIRDAEVNFSKMSQGFIYCLGPYLVIKPIMIVVSNFLTMNESFVLNLANIVTYLWVAVLVVVMIKELNSYTVRATVKVILLTIFALFIGALTLFVLYSLVSQVISFVISLYGEVVVRFGNR